jgi:hypothetical protein
MGVLIAEDFPPQLIKAVAEGNIIRPAHGVWLVEASGFLVGSNIVHYATRACSLPRAEQIERSRAFRKPRSGSATSSAEATSRAAKIFDYIARSGSEAFGQAIKRSNLTVGFYRVLQDNGNNCHIELFVGTNRISVGSCYWNRSLDEVTLERVVAANSETETDPEPDQRYLRGSWWHLRRDIGRDTPLEQLPERLGEEIETQMEAIRSAIDIHQEALKQAMTQSANGYELPRT